MNHSHLRRAGLAAVTALAFCAPAAQAAPSQTVCNEATPVSLGGSYVALDGDPTPPARFTESLNAHRGTGEGLVTAAAHSPALALCGEGGGAPSFVME